MMEKTDTHLEIHIGGINGAGKFTKVDPSDYVWLSRFSWHLNKNGYAVTKINGKHKSMHRMVAEVTDPYIFVDHVDKDRLNNTKKNLRRYTPKENANNMKSNVKIEAFGESKNISQWTEDSRCEVSYAALYNRLNKGIDPETAMKKNGSRRGIDEG